MDPQEGARGLPLDVKTAPEKPHRGYPVLSAERSVMIYRRIGRREPSPEELF
jgi:hypothetical protein